MNPHPRPVIEHRPIPPRTAKKQLQATQAADRPDFAASDLRNGLPGALVADISLRIDHERGRFGQELWGGV